MNWIDLDGIPVPVLTLWRDSLVIQTCNSLVKPLVGQDLPHGTDWQHVDFLSQSDRDAWQAWLMALAPGSQARWLTRVFSATEGEIPVEAVASRGRSAFENLITLSLLDRRPHIANHQAQDTEHMQLVLALQAAQMLGWDCDLQTGQVRYSSDPSTYFGVNLEGTASSWDRELQTVHSDDRAKVLAARERALNGGGGYLVEFRGSELARQQRYYLSRGRVVHAADGRPLRIIGITKDTTARVQSQEQRDTLQKQIRLAQKYESVAVLLGGIAHDFNNMITGLLGFTELAGLAVPAGGEAAEYLGQVESIALRARDLCRQLLVYAGKARPVAASVDLAALMKDMSGLLQSVCGNSVRLKWAGEPAVVYADATQLRQVLLNLVKNGADAHGKRPGFVHVRVGARCFSRSELEFAVADRGLPAGEYAFFEVRDSGDGMSETLRMKIFDPYFTTKPDGHGLGLATVLGITRSHGGTVLLESEVGQGSRFTIVLPLARQCEETSGMACETMIDHPVPAALNAHGHCTT